MAVQQRRNSKTRKAKRRTHYKLSAPAMVKCASCGELGIIVVESGCKWGKVVNVHW